jgi:Uma2 family endonuclease
MRRRSRIESVRRPNPGERERGGRANDGCAKPAATPTDLDDVTRIADADDQHRYELAEGNLVIRPPGTWRLQKVSGLLFAWFARHGYDERVNLAPGVRTAAENLNGRIPDLVVATGPVPDDTVWLAPEQVTLAVEIVSKGSERTDRWFKPVEYAAAGIPRLWLIEPDDTVVQFHLSSGACQEDGRIPLAEMLSGEVPDLSVR